MTEPADKPVSEPASHSAVGTDSTRHRRRKRRLHARLFRWSWQLCCLLLVLVACYVSAGRLLMPLVASQIPDIETRLSEALGLNVTIADLQGSWFRFSPGLEVGGLRLLGTGEVESLVVNRAFLTVDMPASLWRRQLVIDRINMDGMQLVLQQAEDGRWTLAGLAGGGQDYTRQILDLILETRHLALTESALVLQRNDGTVLEVASLFLDLQNGGVRHELRSQFRLNDQASPSRVLVDLDGDPRGEFSASAYVDTTGLDVLPLLPAQPVDGWGFSQFNAGGRALLELDQDGLQRVRSSLTALSFRMPHADAVSEISVDNASLNFQALPERGASGSVDSWELDFSAISFDFQQTPWDIAELQLQLPLQSNGVITVRASALDVAMLQQMLTNMAPLSPNSAEIIATLNPRGNLRNVKLESAADGNYPGGFLLQANFDQLEVDAWNGAPAGRGLQGYVEADADSGFTEVASNDAELYLPRLFAQPWRYDLLNTRVSWRYDEDELHVASSAINVANSGLRGSVQFGLLNTRDSNGALRSDLSLMVGMEHMDVAMRSLYLPTLPGLRETMTWLDAALQGGVIRNSGFIMRTSTLPEAPQGSSSFSTWYHVEDGELQFLPNWPAVQDITGYVHVQNGTVDVLTSGANIAGLVLEPVHATLVPFPEGGNLLEVSGAGTGSTGAGLDLLRSTPIRDTIGSFLDNWEGEGAVRASIKLALPLGAASREQEISVDVESTDSTLRIPEHALDISAINGLVSYRSNSGLAANALQARLFDAPLMADIETLVDSQNGRFTRVSGSGTAAVTVLREWVGHGVFVRRLLAHTEGVLAYQATLDIHGPDTPDGVETRLALRSDMLGMASNLPEPLARSADETGALNVDLAFGSGELLLGLRYNDLLSGQLVLDQQGINRGQLFVGELNRDFTARQSDDDMPGVLVNGALPRFDYEAWREVADSLQAGIGEGEGQSLEDYLRMVDVDLGTLLVAGQELSDINVQVTFPPEGMLIRGINERVSGTITLPPGEGSPWQVNLDYLRFPPRPEPPPETEITGDEAVVDMLVDVDPRQLPAFDFNTPEISIGEDNLGSFSFRLRPSSTGATIADFRMQSPDAGISDRAGSGGANLDWRYQGGAHNSSFNGLLVAGNLARVLPAWGHDAFVESQRGRFSGTLQWPGSPLAFALKLSSGQILMDINSGRFVDIESGSSRLVGALNFDSLARRLQLDFSDLFQRGFAFDRISGNLNFDEGVVTPNGGILIEGPSSRITINGEIDLAARNIAADMIVRIPLGQNISMLAGILGAWPIALSTYLASKIFQDQVDDFATVIYRLEGPWDNPSAGFEAPQELADPTTDTAP